MGPPTDNPVHLSVTRVFVVQFRADTAVEQGYLTGAYVSQYEPFADPFRYLHSVRQQLKAGVRLLSRKVLFRSIVVCYSGYGGAKHGEHHRDRSFPQDAGGLQSRY
jgi:hypothetical protein